jgi:putative peptidoglycan lipid II flippase
VLAFPATHADTTVQDDLRGIGGAFYALLVNRWPPQDPMPADWAAADLDEAGWPKEPAAVEHRVPFLLSSAAAGLVRPDNGVDSAAELLNLLRLAHANTNSTATEDESYMQVMPPLAVPAPDRYAEFRNVDGAVKAKYARRQLMHAMFLSAAAIIAVGVTSLGSSLNDVLGDNDDVVAMDAEKLGLNPSTAAESPPQSAPQQEQSQTAAAAPIVPVSAAVFSPDGSPDNPDDAGKTIDGDPASGWATDRYYDADPFPKFKEGLGLLIRLPQPTALDAVTVDLKSAGTVVQVRGASGDDPKALTDTVDLSAPTPMQPGVNRIALTNRTPTSSVLVWISTLGSTDGSSRAEISEITFSPTPRA